MDTDAASFTKRVAPGSTALRAIHFRFPSPPTAQHRWRLGTRAIQAIYAASGNGLNIYQSLVQ
jgi:hypothetical protein